MNSENPAERKQATTHLIASSMATAHRMAVAQAMRMMNAQVAQVLPNFVQEQITQHQQRQEIFQDFYGKFPDLSAPPIRNVIVDQAKQLQQQMGNPGWTPAFRDALGQHVRNMLRGYVSPTGTQAPPAPPPVPSGVMTPPSARSAQIGTPQAQNPWDDLM
ncbi:MAG: hypothetical protein C0436_05505, partial [Alphaproteobacteria bacterium]|nr:hypothetical protein [Alphaproteobacteria bacterium]